MTVAVRKGDVIAGKYRVERVLGKGAMGVVVAATHLELEQRVAIKLMVGTLFERPEMMARFRQEARAVAKIKSEHVARVLDVGEIEGGGPPYMVMEYLEGQDLSALLSSRGPLPGAEAVGYLLQACEALAEAHGRGIVHRDLKPENLFLAARPDGSSLVKVLDFGISKGPGEPGLRLTGAAAVMGSPLYMPPEQLRSARDVDPRSDIWSLGVILYELFSGRTPYGGDDLTELVTDVMTNPPPPLGRADLPPGLEAAVFRCLRRERDERFGDVAELAAALAPFGPAEARAAAERVARVLNGSMRPSAEPPPRVSIVPLASSAAFPTARELLVTPASTKALSAARSRRTATALLAAFVAVSAGVIGGGTLALRRSSSGPPAPPPGLRTDLAPTRPPGAESPPNDAHAPSPARGASPVGAPLGAPDDSLPATRVTAPAATGAPPGAHDASAEAGAETPGTSPPPRAVVPGSTRPPQTTASTPLRPPQAQASTPTRSPQTQGAPSYARPTSSPAAPPTATPPSAFDMPIK
jgi:serine/threonine protein kinase